MFVDLIAAYDTVWHRGLTYKLLRLLPDKNMVRMIMELVRNRSFTLTTGDSKRSRLRRLKNGVPQRLVMAPLLFNIYVYDLPSTVSRRYVYADDLALLYPSDDWKDLEGVLTLLRPGFFLLSKSGGGVDSTRALWQLITFKLLTLEIPCLLR